MFSDTDSILIVASSNKKLRLSLDIFSDDESEEADEDDISTSVLPQEIPEKQSILISVEVQDRIASLFSKITLCEEQMKTDPSSILLIGVLCEIIDEALEMTQSCLPRNSASLFFLSICIHQLQLHSAKMISDEQFLRLVESYVDSNLRSIENILFFVIGVVLQRVRKLHSPSSRLLVKAIEICITQCSENFNFVLSRILTPPFKLEPSATSSSIDLVQENFDVNSFQYELVQRIIRQNSYFNSHNINSLLANLMTPSDVASWTLQMKFSEEYFLLDAFLNSTYTLPFQTEPIVQYISNFTENKLIPSCFPITQDSVKFLGSIFQSVCVPFLSIFHHFIDSRSKTCIYQLLLPLFVILNSL